MKLERKSSGHVQRTRAAWAGAFTLCAAALTGCHWDMWNNARYKPLEPSPFFGEGQSSSRTLLADSVPYQQAHLDTTYYQGKNADGTFVAQLPREIELSRETLHRGMDRFMIYCTPCHGYTGNGDGMIVNRGFPLPPSWHIDRLREAQVGYFYDVITNGFGRMYSYGGRIPRDDRWAIAAFVRALQLSQAGTSETLPADMFNEIKQLAKSAAQSGADTHGGDQADPSHETGNHEAGAAEGETAVAPAEHGEADQHGTNDDTQH